MVVLSLSTTHIVHAHNLVIGCRSKYVVLSRILLALRDGWPTEFLAHSCEWVLRQRAYVLLRWSEATSRSLLIRVGRVAEDVPARLKRLLRRGSHHVVHLRKLLLKTLVRCEVICGWHLLLHWLKGKFLCPAISSDLEIASASWRIMHFN